MSRLTERYKEKVFCKADCSEMIDYAEDCECPHLQKMKEKLAHYEDLEEQGLLLKLPFPIGSTIYKHEYPTKVDANGVEWKVLDRKRMTVEPLKFALCHLEHIGDWYFLTKAEAEKALAEMTKDCTDCRNYWQNTDTENECNGQDKPCHEFVEMEK